MTNVKFNTALIVGAGAGLSASLARALAKDGIKVALAARTTAAFQRIEASLATGSRPAQELQAASKAWSTLADGVKGKIVSSRDSTTRVARDRSPSR